MVMDKFYCETQLSDRISKTPEGFLVCHDVPITVAGDMYYSPDQVGRDIKAKNGHVRVAKDIEQIHSDETIRSFEGKPITLGHPRDESGEGVFVTPENAMSLSRGVIQNVRPGSGKSFDKLLADFVIMDKEAIELVESGTVREVSCGYNYEAANVQDGFFEQTNIRGNHVALVPRGRAGPQCAIFDSKEEKGMSLKEKLRDALSVFSKAIDAVPEEDDREDEDEEDEGNAPKKSKKGSKKPMAVKKKAAKAAAAKDAADDDEEDDMDQAEEDMGMVKVHARLDRVEELLGDLAEKLREMSESDEDDAADAAEETYDADTLSHAEILAPGISKTGKDIKKRALDECYKTDSGKKIIDSLLCGKSFDAADHDMLFVAASTLVGAQRSQNMKQTFALDVAPTNQDYRSAEAKNRKNEEFWSKHKIGVNN